MINELTYLNAPLWIIFIVVGIAILSTFVGALQKIWDFIAPKLFKIQTKRSQKKQIEEIILKNQTDIQKLNERQDEDHYSSIAADKEIREEIQCLKIQMGEIGDSVLQMRIDTMRSQILDFSSACTKRIYTREYYEEIFSVYDEYEKLLAVHGLKNGRVDNSMKVIERKYQWCIENDGFLHDGSED